jgi:leader peptidase (prepilin peptidase)/N-methyltransferase
MEGLQDDGKRRRDGRVMSTLLDGLPRTAFLAICFIVGTFMGSFISVLTWRIPRDEQWVKGHSACPACHHALGVLDLVPVLSYVFLRGRCRYCGAHIGVRYPLVELATGLLFVGVGWTSGASVLALQYAVMTVLLLAVGLIDFETGLVPDALVLPGAVIGLLFALLGGWRSLLSSIAGAVTSAGLFALVVVVSSWYYRHKYKGVAEGPEGGMGWGDVTFGAMIGAFLGLRHTLVFLPLAFIIGACAGVGLMLLAKKKGEDAMPFGPSMALGAYVAALAGNTLIQWYLTTLFRV